MYLMWPLNVHLTLSLIATASVHCFLQLKKRKMLKNIFFFLFSHLPPLALSATRKNVLFIGSDDMRPNLNLYSDVTDGVFASPTMHTPNLDKVLAKSQNIWYKWLKVWTKKKNPVRREEHGVWVGVCPAGALQSKSLLLDDQQKVFGDRCADNMMMTM